MKHYSKYYKKNNIVSKELNFFLDYNEFFFLKKKLSAQFMTNRDKNNIFRTNKYRNTRDHSS